MGNSMCSKNNFEYSLLTGAEKPIVIGSFMCMSKDSNKIKRNKLHKFWEMQLDTKMLTLIENFLFGREKKVGFQKFAGLFVFSVRGTVEEKILTLKMSMKPAKKKNEVIEINRTFVKEV